MSNENAPLSPKGTPKTETKVQNNDMKDCNLINHETEGVETNNNLNSGKHTNSNELNVNHVKNEG